MLGESGYTQAIVPLKKHLASKPVAMFSSGTSGCTANPDPISVLEETLAKLSQR
ncbi:MAG: hypothetical protein WBC71_13325 [Salaquimonas sp.]